MPASETTPLRGALIGCGFFGGIQAEAWSRIPEAHLVAACDPEIERARAVSPHAFQNPEELLRSTPLDFVDIATRPDSHLPLIRLALQHRVPVICQKPLANTIEEAREIAALAEVAGVPVMVHENWRWQPWYREAHRLLQAGAVGEPVAYFFRLRQKDGWGTEAYPNQPYFRSMPRLLIHETLVHLIDTARFFFGDVRSVYARTRRVNPVITGEDRALLMLAHVGSDLDGVIDGHRFTNPVPPGPAMGDAVIEGEAGVLQINAAGRITIDGREVYPPPSLTGYKGDSVRAVQMHFVECLRTGSPMESTVERYWNTVAAVEAAYLSVSSGCAEVVAA